MTEFVCKFSFETSEEEYMDFKERLESWYGIDSVDANSEKRVIKVNDE